MTTIAHLLFEQGGSFWNIVNRDQHFVKPGHFSKEMSKAIHKVFDLRQMGDYREFVTLEKDQVKEVLDLADGFVDEVERFFHKD